MRDDAPGPRPASDDAVTIRHVEPRDHAQIRALYAEDLAYADTLQLPYPSIELWEQRLATPRDGQHALVAVRGDEVLGQLTIETSLRARRRHVATLGMAVRASARGRGVGTRLLAAAIDLADRWLHATRIEIEVYVENAAAIALYEKHGFVREGVARQFAFRDGVYVDALRMARIRPP